MPSIAISGASGFIGSALAARFRSKGWSVVELARRERPCSRYFDLRDNTADINLHNIDVLVHAAYVQEGTPERAYRVNVDGSLRLFEEARRQGVAHLVFISSFSAQKHAEASYGRQKYAIETWVNRENGSIIRPGLVIGNGGLFAAIKWQVQRYGIIPVIDGGCQPLQTVYIDDLVSAVEASIDRKIFIPLNVAESVPLPYHEFFKLLAQRLQRRVFMMPVSSRLGLAAVNCCRAMRISLPISSDNLLGARDLCARETRISEDLTGVTFRSASDSLNKLLLVNK